MVNSDIDTEKIQDVIEKVENNTAYIEDLVNLLLSPYCGELDELMLDWKSIMKDKKHPPTEDEIIDIVLELPIILHYVAEGAERLGIKEDVSAIIRNEIYNKAHLNATGKVADKQSIAELEALEESIVQCTYKRASKLIKDKLEAGYELYNAAKKVLGFYQVKIELTKVEGTKGRRNEERR